MNNTRGCLTKCQVGKGRKGKKKERKKEVGVRIDSDEIFTRVDETKHGTRKKRTKMKARKEQNKAGIKMDMWSFASD